MAFGFRTCLVVAIVVTASIGGCKAPPPPSADNTASLNLHTRDGYVIAATLFKVDAPHPPGIVLIPMLGATRDTWTPLAAQLQREGVMAIAIDPRGHGNSQEQNGRHVTYQSFSTEDWRGVKSDIAAAVDALKTQGADPENLALIGASIGANLALQYAADHTDIQALVLLSPGLAYHGITTEDAMKAYMPRPILLVASEGDDYAAQSCRKLESVADQSFAELRLFNGSAHGTDLFAASRNVIPQILQWLELILHLQPSHPQ